ncbi:MAG: glycosyltransferase, partial [bacterium]|nr:glycosyltransferase [bacterium]
MIKLSIVIANLNTKKLTLECIASIYKQNLSFPFEVIVVDDGSNDGSVEALAEIEKERKNYKFIANKKNSGYAKANNNGLKIAKGQYWLLLNSDTIVKKNALENLIKFADETPDAGVIGSKLLNADGSLQSSCFRFPTIKNAILECWFGKKGLFEKFAPKANEATQVNAVVGAVFLITPEAKKRVGMLDERYWAYFEDIDYCRQVWKKGLKVYYLPKSEIIHYHGASFKKLADEKNQWRKLIPSSKIYHGIIKHYILTLIILIGQKWRKITWVILVILLTIPAVWNLLRPGLFSMQDDLQAFRIYEMDKCFDDGQIPCRWVPDAGYRYGYPQFNYYPPSVYYAGVLLHRAGFQYIDAVKILFVLGYFASAITMFILIDSLLGSWPAFVSSLLYTYVPYKAVEVYVRGAMSEFWALVFLPVVFWSIYKFIKTENLPAGRQGIKYFIYFSVSIALLITTHNLTTLIFAPFAVIWALYWLTAEKKWKVWSKIALSGLLGIGLASFYFLPVLFERQFVHVESMLSGYFDYRQHFVSLYKMFISREWGYGSSGFPKELLNLSTGTVQWVMGIIAFFLGLANYKKQKKLSLVLLIFVACVLFVIFMMHIKSSFIWARLPFLWWLMFPWRFLSMCLFIL